MWWVIRWGSCIPKAWVFGWLITHPRAKGRGHARPCAEVRISRGGLSKVLDCAPSRGALFEKERKRAPGLSQGPSPRPASPRDGGGAQNAAALACCGLVGSGKHARAFAPARLAKCAASAYNSERAKTHFRSQCPLCFRASRVPGLMPGQEPPTSKPEFTALIGFTGR